MARITVEDCLRRVDNRFELVLMATRRARQLERGAAATVPEDGDKPAVIALREIAGNTIDAPTIDRIEQEYQDRKAREAIEWAASEWRDDADEELVAADDAPAEPASRTPEGAVAGATAAATRPPRAAGPRTQSDRARKAA